MRVDDELKAYVDGDVKVDDFTAAGWNYNKVSTFDASGAGLLAFWMHNMVSNLCTLHFIFFVLSFERVCCLSQNG